MKLASRLSLFAAVALPLSLSAATISGTVTDKTTGKPASGDTAVLLDLQAGMQESAQTTIDAKGHYSFNVPDNTGMHLVRVDHDKASYYGPVPPNTTLVNIDVYDVSPKVDGLHLYADVSRIETNPQGLSVTESYFIRNESKPPKTQLSAHSFEFYLPQGAVLEGATATGPGGMAVSNQPVPMSDKGHYAFIFPIRPGETRFQVGYHLPYSGSANLQARVTLPAENIAIMLPKSMSFSGSSFQPLGADASGPGTQTWLATNAKPDTSVAFTVSGTGSMPREQQNPQAGPGAMGQGAPGQGAPGQDQGAAGMAGGPDQSGQPAAQQGPGGGLGNSHRHARPAAEIQVVDPQRSRPRAGHRRGLHAPRPTRPGGGSRARRTLAAHAHAASRREGDSGARAKARRHHPRNSRDQRCPAKSHGRLRHDGGAEGRTVSTGDGTSGRQDQRRRIRRA